LRPVKGLRVCSHAQALVRRKRRHKVVAVHQNISK
jgi:hypothetical protein